jgi:hypothetical protein
MTAMEYNYWGGSSGYKIDYLPPGAIPGQPLPRKSPLYLDGAKPWVRFSELGQGADSALIAWLEHRGVNLDYGSDMGLGQTVTLAGYRTIVLGQHTEYVSQIGRNAIADALNKGTNLANFGSNALYWKTTIRSTKSIPLLLQVDRVNDADLFEFLQQPTEALTGTGTTCVGVYASHMTVQAPSDPLFQGIAPEDMTELPGILEQEVENTSRNQIAPYRVLAESTANQCAEGKMGRGTKGQMSEAVFPSGAKAFTAGGFGLACSVISYKDCPEIFKGSEATTRFARQLVDNVMTEYSK